MLEYFSSKKVKKQREEKAEKERMEKENGEATEATEADASAKSPEPSPASPASPKIISKPQTFSPQGTPLLDPEDEKFLERLTSADARSPDHDDDVENRPPLPPRIKTPVIDIDSDASSIISRDDKGKGKEDNMKPSPAAATEDKERPAANKRFSFVTNLSRNISLKRKPTSAKAGLKPAQPAVPDREAQREETDIARVLDDLDLSAQNNKAFSLSKESAEMVRRFTQVLKDLVNGVPTAYGDLVGLIDDRDGVIARGYEKLPNSLKKLVTQLPDKLTSTLAPELLAVAAEAQGLSAEEGTKAGLKGTAKNFLNPKTLQELVTKPGAIAGLLKGIVNALKTRWPAFIGTNVLWSVAVFLLLSALWYCHKRGREVRLEAEAGAAAGDPINGATRVEELPDDPLLPAPSPSPGPGSGSISPKDTSQNHKAPAPAPPLGEAWTTKKQKEKEKKTKAKTGKK